MLERDDAGKLQHSQSAKEKYSGDENFFLSLEVKCADDRNGHRDDEHVQHEVGQRSGKKEVLGGDVGERL